MKNFIKNIATRIKKSSPENKRLAMIRTIGWGLPIVLIPALRFIQDKDKPKSLRKELFVRDFTSYSVGTMLYFTALAVAQPITKKLSINKKMILPELVATSSFCIWSGIFGPKFSKMLNKNKQNCNNVDEKSTIHNFEINHNSNKNVNFERNFKTNKPALYNTNLYSRFKI